MKRVALSWSSGKDSAWALHLLRQQPDIQVVALFTTVDAATGHVAMHHVSRSLVELQAERLGLPVWFVPTPWPCSNAEYEARLTALCSRACAGRVESFVFGDLFLQDIRSYRERLLQTTGITPLFPLWDLDTDSLAEQMITSGLQAKITCVDTSRLDRSFAGRDLIASSCKVFRRTSTRAAKTGEFHTFVYHSPQFSSAIPVTTGDIVERDGFAFTHMHAVDDPGL